MDDVSHELEKIKQKMEVESQQPAPQTSEETGQENKAGKEPKAETWEQITIEIVDDDTIKYKASGKKWERASYTELGFLDNRKHLANKLWPKFLSLATQNRPVSNQPKIVPKDIDRIRVELRKFFGLQEIPIRYDKKNKKYFCNFRFYDKRNW